MEIKILYEGPIKAEKMLGHVADGKLHVKLEGETTAEFYARTKQNTGVKDDTGIGDGCGEDNN